MELEHWDAGERALAEGCFLFRGVEPSRPGGVLPGQPVRAAHSAAGEVIYTPSAFERSLGVVLSGRVQVTKETLLVSVLEPGSLFGAAALFQEREDYATTLTARTPCALLLLPQSLVEQLLERSPRRRGTISAISPGASVFSVTAWTAFWPGAPSAVWPSTSWSGRRTAGSCWESRLRRWPSGSM